MYRSDQDQDWMYRNDQDWTYRSDQDWMYGSETLLEDRVRQLSSNYEK